MKNGILKTTYVQHTTAQWALGEFHLRLVERSGTGMKLSEDEIAELFHVHLLHVQTHLQVLNPKIYKVLWIFRTISSMETR